MIKHFATILQSFPRVYFQKSIVKYLLYSMLSIPMMISNICIKSPLSLLYVIGNRFFFDISNVKSGRVLVFYTSSAILYAQSWKRFCWMQCFGGWRKWKNGNPRYVFLGIKPTFVEVFNYVSPKYGMRWVDFFFWCQILLCM